MNPTLIETCFMTSAAPVRRLFLVSIGACALLLSMFSTADQSTDMPGLEKMVLLNAREQPVDQFFGELFGQLGMPAQVDDSIVGSVNGDFKKPASEVVNEITSAFQLAVYYDGAVAYVYPANDISRNVRYMSSSSAKAVIRAAQKLGMTDSRNTLSATDVGLVVTGAKHFVEQVDQLANAVRKKAKITVPKHDTYRIFPLKFAWADDVTLMFGGETVAIPGVASLIRSLIEPGALGQPTITRTPGSSSRDGLRGQGLSAQGLQSVANSSNAAQLALNQPAIQGLSSGGSTEHTRIVADPLSNSVIIRDRADRMSTYATLIDSLDKEPQMIEIEATIIDLDTDKLRELGINWRLQRGDGEALLGNGTVSDTLLRPNADVTPLGDGGIVSLLLGSQQEFIARIRALEQQGAARIVSKPHVMTLSNVEALLDTTSTFFVRVEGQEEVDLFDVKVGTTLRVTPHVYQQAGREQIKLRVNIVDGSTSDQQVDSIPIVDQSTINTQAIVDVGQSLLIGGLAREISSTGVTRVPLLGRIPGLGALFRTKTKTSSQRERMFLITPRLSAPKVAGKRFSAPLLSGSEADIITSSSTRMDRTREALSLRENNLPAVSSDQSSGLIQPTEQLPPAPANSAEPATEDRPILPPAPSDSGWQEVMTNSVPQLKEPRDSLHQRVRRSEQKAVVDTQTSAVNAEEDGWQVIAQ